MIGVIAVRAVSAAGSQDMLTIPATGLVDVEVGLRIALFAYVAGLESAGPHGWVWDMFVGLSASYTDPCDGSVAVFTMTSGDWAAFTSPQSCE